MMSFQHFLLVQPKNKVPTLHPLTSPQPVHPHMVSTTQLALMRHGVDQLTLLAEVEITPGILSDLRYTLFHTG